jgi:DNA-binding beta-propeller fold protein YncE
MRSLACICLLMALGSTHAEDFGSRKLQLPGAKGFVILDYTAYDSRNQKLWVPAGNLGLTAVIDAKTDRITMVAGFKTGEVELRGKKWVMGPSSVSIGNGVAYVGNRGDSSVCVVDAAALKTLGCHTIGDQAAGLSAAPDAVVYVGATKELWITTGAPPLGIPAANKSILVLDAADRRHLKPKMSVPLEASAEGYVVDEGRGIFFTNLEEPAETVAIDVRKKRILARWKSGCAEPHGLALDEKRGFLFVACDDRVVALDVVRDGKVLGSIQTGEGVDNIDYSATDKAIYAAASKAATLTIARVDDKGAMSIVALVPTVKGARSVIAGGKGTAYLIDPYGGSVLKVFQTSK